MNRTDRPARFLSVANTQHETVFNEFCAIVEVAGSQPMSEQEQVRAFKQVAVRHGGYNVEARAG